MTLTNQALSSAADKDLELSKQVCREAVNEVIKKNHLTLSPQFTQNLVVHLAIAILRIKTNNYIPLSQGQITSYKANTNYDSAVEICNILSKKFDIEFPESELALISMYLSKNNVLDVEFNAGVNLLDDEIIDVLQNTLDSLFKQKGIDLRNNEKLLVSLGLHLTPALDRLLDDSQIENPLTAKIKERHPKEFAMAEILNDAIESIYHKRFTEDEVAYFALHFIVSARQK